MVPWLAGRYAQAGTVTGRQIAVETHSDPRVQACIYEGTHRWESDGFRYPARLPTKATPITDDVDKPVPYPYYTIRGCRACNIEERVYHNMPTDEVSE